MGDPLDVKRSKLKRIPLPPSTAHFSPIPHAALLDTIEDQLGEAGFTVKDEKICLVKDGAIMTCRWTLQHQREHGNGSHAPLVVVFNGNDHKHALRVGLGSMALVCSNGMVSAEKTFALVHREHCNERLPDLVADLLHEHRNWHRNLMNFLDRLRKYRVSREEVNDILVTAMEQDVIPSSHIKKVLDLYLHPSYPEYGEGTLYTLHSAFTEVIRSYNPALMPQKTMALQEILTEALYHRRGQPMALAA